MLYTYQGYHGVDSHCYIEIYGSVVVVTELNDNNGTSVTNFAGNLATLISSQYRIYPDNLIWIEHYEGLEEYALVTFDHDGEEFSNPRWKSITPKMAQNIWETGVIPTS